MGRLCVFALVLAATGAEALEKVEFLVASDDPALTKSLRAASIILAAERDGQTGAQDILSDGRAEYAALLNALYAQGHYSAVIHVYADGREVAGIAPLDTPARIDTVKVTVDPGPRFALSRATVRPLAHATELPEGFRLGAPADRGGGRGH
jgi:translocation and assembly module TamA